MITSDGSVTVAIPELKVTYHSRHGAIQESMHVFIEAGLKPLLHRQETLYIFEMGLGTGLNALLTLIEAEAHQQKIHYQSIEAFPLEASMVAQLNYCGQLHKPELNSIFEQLHAAPWDQPVVLTPWFTFQKSNTPLLNFSISQPAHLLYYDAFAPSAQPELWTVEAFSHLFSMLTAGAVLVTYCSKSVVRRAMMAAGFNVEKIPGPHGKREMVRARRP